MRISEKTIEAVKQRLDILEVIEDYVPLKRSGRSYKGFSPFQEEKTPSFMVEPNKGIFKDFSSGKGGNAISFLMEIEGFSYVDAIKHLANKYQIPIEYDQVATDEEEGNKAYRKERESLLIVLEFAQKHFAQNLLETDEGKTIGLSYFQERGFSLPTIQKFGLGYAQNSWDDLLNAATQQQYNLDYLATVGLIKRNEESQKQYDAFRQRVMFPIYNATGKVVGFGGRILTNDKNQPKYINSPESVVYRKSQELYGLWQARQAIRQQDNCFLTEGYTDVISLHQAGIENVVASSGTSLTQEQIKLIKRYTQNVTVLFDGDSAGIKAALRGIDMLLEQGMNVRAVTFPDNNDPDSFIRKVGTTEFLNYIKQHQKDFLAFKTQIYLSETGNDAFKKAEVIKDIVSSIVKIPDTIARSIFYKQCSELLGVPEQDLITEGNKIALQEQKQQQRKAEQKSVNNATPTKETDEPFLSAAEYADFDRAVADMLDLPPFDAEPAVTETKPKNPVLAALEQQEWDFIRLLVQYGSTQVNDNQYLCHLLLEHLADIHFHTPEYIEVITLIEKMLEKGELPTSAYFLDYPNEKIRNKFIDLEFTKPGHELSEGWERNDIKVKTEADNIHIAATKRLLHLKHQFVQKLIQENQQKLKEAVHDYEVDQILKRHNELKAEAAVFAKALNLVITKKL